MYTNNQRTRGFETRALHTPQPTAPDEFDYLRKFAADSPSGISETAQIRSEARLEQILASPPEPAPTQIRRRQSRSAPSRIIRWVAIPVAAAAIIAAGIVWPNHPVNPAPALTAHAALATWQPIPEPLSAERFELANTRCQEDLNLAAGSAALGDPIIAEQRGDWGFLAYSDVPNHIASCLVWFPATLPEQALVISANLVNGGASSFSAGWGANSAALVSAPQMQLSAMWSGVSGLHDANGNHLDRLNGLGANFDDGTAFQAVMGNLDDATEVPSLQVGDTLVRPTVADGWFAAWWPVTQDTDRLTEIIQCRSDWHELSTLDPDKATQVICPGETWAFTPQLSSLTFTMPDGSAVTYAAGADQHAIRDVAAAVESARTAHQLTD